MTPPRSASGRTAPSADRSLQRTSGTTSKARPAFLVCQGPQGDSGLADAFYATAYYNLGNTNEGAVVTVACDPDSTNYTAIAGGVQVLGLREGSDSRNTPVSSSFPGPMNGDAIVLSRELGDRMG